MARSIEERLQAVRDATERLEALRVEENEVSMYRSWDMAALRQAGVSREALAEAAGLTPARVTQILNRIGEPKGRKVPRREPAEPKKRPRKAPAPEPHRHHFVSEAWNHTRGAYLVRQRCECGETRVIPSPSIPKELRGGPDVSIVA